MTQWALSLLTIVMVTTSTLALAAQDEQPQATLDVDVILDAIEPDDPVLVELEELDRRIISLDVDGVGIRKGEQRLRELRLFNLERERTTLLHDHIESLLKDDKPLSDALKDILLEESNRIQAVIRRIAGTVTLPQGKESAAELAMLTSGLQRTLERAGVWHEAMLRNLELSKEAGLDVVGEEEELRNSVRERAANASTYLELTMHDLAAVRNRASVLPDDLEAKALFTVTAAMVGVVADELKKVSSQLESLGIDASQYRSQLIAATGLISSDVFSAGVLSELINSWAGATGSWMRQYGVSMVFNLMLFILIIFVARYVSRWVRTGTETALRMAQTPLSTLLQRMLVSTASSSVYIIGVLVALSQLGISLGPILTGLGIAGFIVGFALQDTLSNFASGMMILLYRPFDVGDWIDAEGAVGEVASMSLVNTTVMTIDNQTLIVPNSKIWGNVIKNVTGQRLRRIDFRFGVSYSADIPHVEKVLGEIVAEDERIFSDPAPIIKVHELGESSVNFICRPWVKTDEYWNVYWDTLRTVKMRFDEEGISIPFPQRDVHIYEQPAREKGA